jgi:hypothetical protein
MKNKRSSLKHDIKSSRIGDIQRVSFSREDLYFTGWSPYLSKLSGEKKENTINSSKIAKPDGIGVLLGNPTNVE